MISFTRFTGLVATLAIAGMLAGCAGSATPPSGNALPIASSQLPARGPIAERRMKCAKDSGVSVRPCKVELTASKTSAMVKTKGPKGGTFVVRDTHCASKDIVTVTGSKKKWTITAGSSKGLCVVNFVDKDPNGKKNVNNEGS
jgi:hypothetical protein